MKKGLAIVGLVVALAVGAGCYSSDNPPVSCGGRYGYCYPGAG